VAILISSSSVLCRGFVLFKTTVSVRRPSSVHPNPSSIFPRLGSNTKMPQVFASREIDIPKGGMYYFSFVLMLSKLQMRVGACMGCAL